MATVPWPTTPYIQSALRKLQAGALACILVSSLTASGLFSALTAQAAVLGPAAVSMTETVRVPDNGRLITLSVSDAPVTDVLRNLSEVGKLNLLVDDAIDRTVSVELQDVTINDALSAIVSLASLEVVPQGGNVYLIIPRTRAEEVGLNRRFSHIIPLQFANANQMATILNQSLFAADNQQLQQSGGGMTGGYGSSLGGGGGSGGQNGGQGNVVAQKIRADSRTNSLIVVGSQRDIDLTEAAVKALDKPRDARTFYLNYANAVDVATQLMSSVFNDGTMGFMLSNGSAASGGGNSSAGGGGGMGGLGGSGGGAGGAGSQGGNLQLMQTPSSLRVETEDIAEGTGINTLNIGNTGSGATSSFSEVVLRGTVKTSQTAQVSPMGVIVVPDTRLNAVTVMGTPDQIALAERILPALDAEPPQVSIEVSLVEISETKDNDLGSILGIDDGKLQFGFNNTSGVGLNTVDATGNVTTGLSYTTDSIIGTGSDYVAQINALISKSRAKVLANPTIVANHDTEAIVSLVDEIIRRVTVEVEGLSGTTTITTEIGEAGIVLDILPKIGEDGTVSMRIRPSITSIRDIVEDEFGNVTTLLTRRDLLAQMVRVKDGQTLIMGGLVKEGLSVQKDKIPLLGDLPIVGALFRASSNESNRSEVVMMLTPHILNPVQPVQTFTRDPLATLGSAGMNTYAGM